MKIKKTKKSNKKIITIISAIIISTAGIYSGIAYYNKTTQSNDTKTIKDQGTNNNKNNDTSLDTKQIDQSEDNTSTSGDVPVVFTSINQNGAILQVRVLIETVSDSGVCGLTMTKDAITISKTADIQAGPKTSTCKGFDINLNELSLGDWQIKVSVDINSRNGSATETYKIE